MHQVFLWFQMMVFQFKQFLLPKMKEKTQEETLWSNLKKKNHAGISKEFVWEIFEKNNLGIISEKIHERFSKAIPRKIFESQDKVLK